MYGHTCLTCRKVIILTDKDNEITYFRLGNNEEFYCKKCGEKVALGENDKVVREGKTFMTVMRSDY